MFLTVIMTKTRKEKEREGLETCGDSWTSYFLLDGVPPDLACRGLIRKRAHLQMCLFGPKEDGFCVQKRTHQKGYILSVITLHNSSKETQGESKRGLYHQENL